MRKYIWLFVFCLGLTRCSPRPTPPATQSGNVIGSVGSAVITDTEFLDRIAKIEKEFPRKFSTHPQKLNLLTEMMNLELLSQEALRQEMDKTFEFKARLADLYVQKISEAARATIKDSDIQSFYSENKNQYDQISARHILFKDKSRKAELEKIRAELVKNPDAFPQVASSKSEDGTAPNGGELGFFSAPMMTPTFAQAAFKLKKIGEISPVTESPFGYHIIQLTGDRRDLSFSKDLIRNELLRRSQQERLARELDRLKKGKKFEIYGENLLKLSELPNVMKEDPSKIIQWNTKEPTPK